MDSDQIDHAALIAACARGDRAALRRLYDAEGGRLIAIAERIVRRRALAEEVVQDAMIQIWQKAAGFDPSIGSARAWIYTLTRHRALNVLRDGRREDLVDPETVTAMTDQTSLVEDVFDRMPLEDRLKSCLEALDPAKRKSVLLSYVAGYSHGEIAGLLKVPVGTAKSWVRRALTSLKDCMA